jgi:UDP-N-acetyl-2-amino-2-deoxyglucuronate dehydrogenase
VGGTRDTGHVEQLSWREKIMRKTFTFVIIGSGMISRNYFQAMKKIDAAEIVGVVSRSGAGADHIHAHIEVATDISRISKEFDAVIIATPNGLHHEGAIASAARGKHVLTEKPLDITAANMDQMIGACAAHKVKLGVVYQHRLSPDYLSIKKLLEAKSFGRIYCADFAVRCWRDQEYYDSGQWRGTWKVDGGGPFMQQACHELDLYTWFFGMPEEVVAFTGTYGHTIEVEDHGVAIFRHADGMVGSFIASTVAYPGFDPSLAMHTERGTVLMTNGRITGWHIREMENPSRQLHQPLHSAGASAVVKDVSGHQAVIEEFISAVQENREPFISGASARAATELALRIYGDR